MLRLAFLCSVLSLLFHSEVVEGGFSSGLTKIANNIRSRSKLRHFESTSVAVSVAAGATGIWYRSSVIAAINYMEHGEKEKALETLNIAIATLSVFDITQATVSPIASELIQELVKQKGYFPETVTGLTEYNNKVTQSITGGSADDVDDIIGAASDLRSDIKKSFSKEVDRYIRKTQIHDDLVTSLKNAKRWAKVAKYADVLTGPIFDAALVAFSGWQLYNAIHDNTSPPQVRSLNIASASLGVACGTVGLASFAVGALATVGTTLAAVAGPVGLVIAGLLSIAAIMVDVINSNSPYGIIKSDVELIEKMKKESLNLLKDAVEITSLPSIPGDAFFSTIYQLNQGNLLQGMRTGEGKKIAGVDKAPFIKFDAKREPGRENDHLTMGKQRFLDRSKYATFFHRPTGKQPLGYDFYGKVKNSGGGMTVRATTTSLDEKFWFRGLIIDTRVRNDEREKKPDNVVIGQMSGLLHRASMRYGIRVNTGAGNDLLQLNGIVCFDWRASSPCFVGDLGTGLDTLSFQGMNTSSITLFPTWFSQGKVLLGLKFDMRKTGEQNASLYLRLSPPGRFTYRPRPIEEYKIGTVRNVNVLYASPLQDEVVMGDDKDCLVKTSGKGAEYVIYLYNKRDFTHTIIADSESLGRLYLVGWSPKTGTFYDYYPAEVAYDIETQTLAVFMKSPGSNKRFNGRIIFQRTKPGDIKKIRVFFMARRHASHCEPVPSLALVGFSCIGSYTLGKLKRTIGSENTGDRPVPSIPFHYYINRDIHVKAIPGLTEDFVISLHANFPRGPGDRRYSLQLPTNSILVVEKLVKELKNFRSAISLFYSMNEKTLTFHRDYRTNPPTNKSVVVHVPRAKRIVVGTPGSYELLFDLKHDDRQAVNLGSEYLGLKNRPAKDYRFASDVYLLDEEPKQIVLGVPLKHATEKKWKILLHKAKTELGNRYGDDVKGDYAENALIVNDVLWAYLSRKGNDIQVLCDPQRGRYKWNFRVMKGRKQLHSVTIEGANTLAYHEKLIRVNLYHLAKDDREPFDLYQVWKAKMEAIENDYYQ